MTRPLSLRDTLIRATLPAASPPAPLCAAASSHGRQVPYALLPSLPSHSFSPSGWSGECVRSLGCAGLAKPATDPYSGTWDSLPPVGRFAAAASACGASGFAAFVSHLILGPCRVRIPLSVPPILLTCDH